jgi:Type II secretory pathway, pullulanase PulA and related glycosidases
VIAYSTDLDPALYEDEIQKRIRLGNAIILTSQGVAFIHAGQEYGRTKQWKSDIPPTSDYAFSEGFQYPYFIENSYDASDAVNMFDWDKVTKDGIQKTTMEFTKGLIQLRKSTDAFRLGTEDEIATNVRLIESPDIKATDLVIAYSATASTGEEFIVVLNADNQERAIQMDVDLNSGMVVVDADEAGIHAVSEPNGYLIQNGTLFMDPLTVIVIKK